MTHDHRIEEVADRVLRLEDGKLLERPPEEAMLARTPCAWWSSTCRRPRAVAGRPAYFCWELCLERFDANPERFARRRG